MTIAANYEMRVASLGYTRQSFLRMVVATMNDPASQVPAGEYGIAAKMVYESCRACISPETMRAERHWLAKYL